MYDQLGGRLPPLLDRRALAGAALREDALRQRAAGRRVRRGLPGDRARRLRPRRARHARLPAARDDRPRRRLLFGDRRRLEAPRRQVRGGRVLRLVRGGDPRRCWAPARRPIASSATTASRRQETSRARTSSPSPRPTRRSTPRWRPQRAALYAARAQPVAAVPRREDPRRLERPGDLGVRRSAGRVFDEPRYVDAAARAATLRARQDAPGRPARAQRQGRPRRRRRLPRRLRVRVRGADRSLRGDVRARAGCARRSRSPTRPSACSPIRRGGWFMTAADHETADRAREARLRRRRAVGHVGRAAQRACASRRSRPTIAGARSPTARSPPIAPTLIENPLALTEALLALDYASDEAKEIAIVWPRDATPTPRAPLLDVVRRTFVPNHALAAASEADAPALGTLIPFIADKTAVRRARHRLRLRPRPLRAARARARRAGRAAHAAACPTRPGDRQRRVKTETSEAPVVVFTAKSVSVVAVAV